MLDGTQYAHLRLILDSMNTDCVYRVPSLRQSWYDALDGAQNHFRQLLTSHSSNEWKRVSAEGSQSSLKGKARAAAGPQLSDVILHRKI